MTRVVLVNGVPASGKSTLARALSRQSGWPLLALDTIKEALFAELGIGDRLYNRTMGRASYRAIFAAIGDFPPASTVLIDAWFGFQPRELLDEHLARAGVDRAVELWCAAPPETIGARYSARVGKRGAGHLGASYVPELIELAKRAAPLGGFPLLRIDATKPFDVGDILAWVLREAPGSGG
jgi:glucokinase